MRKSLAALAIAVVGIFTAIKVYDSDVKSQMAPANAEVSRLRDIARDAVPLLNKYNLEHGRYPCHLQEVLGPKAIDFENPPPVKASYRATGDNYYLYVTNSSATSVIHWGAGQSAISWVPCTSVESCPPGIFAKYCCDSEGYPKCDSYR